MIHLICNKWEKKNSVTIVSSYRYPKLLKIDSFSINTVIKANFRIDYIYILHIYDFLYIIRK